MVPVVLLTLTATTSLTTLKTVFTDVVGWLVEFVGAISQEPLLLLGFTILVVGLIAGLAFRVIRGKGRGRP